MSKVFRNVQLKLEQEVADLTDILFKLDKMKKQEAALFDYAKKTGSSAVPATERRELKKKANMFRKGNKGFIKDMERMLEEEVRSQEVEGEDYMGLGSLIKTILPIAKTVLPPLIKALGSRG